MGHKLQPTLTKSPIGHIKPNGRQGHASTNAPKPCRPTNYNQHDRHQRYDFQRKSQLRAADTQNKLHRRPTNYNYPPTIPRLYAFATTGGKATHQHICQSLAAQRITMLTAPTSKTSCTHPPRTNMRTKGRGHELQLHSLHQQICPNRIRHRAYQRIATNHDPNHGGIT